VNFIPTPILPYGLATLRYSLLTGPVELAPLRVLAFRCVRWKAWSVTFSVLGASHAVCLERGESRLTELLACAVGKGPSLAILQEDGVQKTNYCLHAEGLVCEAEWLPFPLTEDAALSQQSAPENRLEVAYPPPAETATPYTRIGWHATAEALHVETVHTYPEEGRGVRSRTVFREERHG
jgi:uncharacterized protein YbaR (Trm112 family)